MQGGGRMREVVRYYSVSHILKLEHKHTDMSSSVASSPFSYQYVNMTTYSQKC